MLLYDYFNNNYINKIEMILPFMYIVVLQNNKRIKINMSPKKKFNGRKLELSEVSIHISRKYDEEREIYCSDDCILAHYLKKYVDNDIQEHILGFIGENNVKYEEDYDDEIEMYEYNDENDFVIDTTFVISEKELYVNNNYKKQYIDEIREKYV